jgi:hypothetical protein
MILASISVATAQTAKDPFSITISTASPTVTAGSHVYVRVKLTNMSDQTVDCTSAYTNGLDQGLHYDVRNEDEKSVLKPDIQPDRYPMSLQSCSLEAGESKEHQTLLNWLYDLSKPGQYVIQISRRTSDGPNPQYVKSNTITITVVAPDSPAAAPQ